MREIRSVYTVGQLNSYIKNMFMQDYLLQSLSVKGEVSNCKYHSSGHIYFTLKDAKGTMNCVMFAGNREGLGFRLSEGQQVIVSGAVDVYERDGKYQLYAKQILLDGVGRLYEQYERLKRELEELGMFAQLYKQPIPSFIRTLGIVTADTGAAVRDIIQIASRRNPYVQIILYPAYVQGEEAVASIVQGIRTLEQIGVDVMIVGRGGGSIEDLWAFNEREVAQAVFDCSVPIISAVGHETDTTIIDFVADLRAPTPSAAAELAVCEVRELLSGMETIRERLYRAMIKKVDLQREYCAGYQRQLRGFRPVRQVREQKMYCMQIEEKIKMRMEELCKKKRHDLAIYIERMKGLSPLEKLNSGYAYVEDVFGNPVRSIQQIKEGNSLHVHMKDGIVTVAVQSMQTAKQGKKKASISEKPEDDGTCS